MIEDYHNRPYSNFNPRNDSLLEFAGAVIQLAFIYRLEDSSGNNSLCSLILVFLIPVTDILMAIGYKLLL